MLKTRMAKEEEEREKESRSDSNEKKMQVWANEQSIEINVE